jgi:hypothetical protein
MLLFLCTFLFELPEELACPQIINYLIKPKFPIDFVSVGSEPFKQLSLVIGEKKATEFT